MNEHVLDLLSSYLDEELNSNEKERVEKHLQKCSSCHHELTSLRRIQQALSANYSFVQPSPSLQEKIQEQIRLRSQEKALERGVVIGVSLIALMLIYVFLQFFSIIKAIGHTLYIFFHLGTQVLSIFWLLVSGNSYVSMSVIGVSAVVILLMSFLIGYLLISSSIDTRRGIL